MCSILERLLDRGHAAAQEVLTKGDQQTSDWYQLFHACMSEYLSFKILFFCCFTVTKVSTIDLDLLA